jgi:iron-sulfur cluster assembly protein
MTINIHFTDAAAAYIQAKIAAKHAVGLRLSIKKTGCSGYSYAPAIVDSAIATDMIFTLANGVTIFVDPLWAHLLEGVMVDYLEEDKMGLKQKRLIFSNPNEASRCGCGESFHV